jgi:hypothetical protein
MALSTAENLLAGTIRLEPGTTKNDEGRDVSMTLPVRTLLTQCIHGKAADDYVFTREGGTPVRHTQWCAQLMTRYSVLVVDGTGDRRSIVLDVVLEVMDH